MNLPKKNIDKGFFFKTILRSEHHMICFKLNTSMRNKHVRCLL